MARIPDHIMSFTGNKAALEIPTVSGKGLVFVMNSPFRRPVCMKLAPCTSNFVSPKVSNPRVLIGSILWGCTLGAIGTFFFTHPAPPIALAMGGVLTAPMTIAKMQKMTILDVVNELKDRLEK